MTNLACGGETGLSIRGDLSIAGIQRRQDFIIHAAAVLDRTAINSPVGRFGEAFDYELHAQIRY